jgi:hypothetical protein
MLVVVIIEKSEKSEKGKMTRTERTTFPNQWMNETPPSVERGPESRGSDDRGRT